MIELDLRWLAGRMDAQAWRVLQPQVDEIHRKLHIGDVPGGEYLGWLHWPSRLQQSRELTDILEAAADIRANADALVVIGIGGSYLGTRAAFEWCKPEYYNQLPADVRGGPELYFAGHHLSEAGLRDLLRVLTGKRVALNVISKSGTTTEPAVSFRLLRRWLEQTVGVQEARRRIFATTDGARGTLKALAEREGYRTFTIPDNIGGRFSVLTAVGLLPLASIGVEILEMLRGAATAERTLGSTSDLDANSAYAYAAVRTALYRSGRTTEMLAYYEPALYRFAEWWKQLFGESEGKNGRGIFPAALGYTTDLHSLGQYVQEGRRDLFETVLSIDDATTDVSVPAGVDFADGLDYLADRRVSDINRAAQVATQIAHCDGDVPNLQLHVGARTERTLGELFYFFEYACAASALLLGVNPFDQPGVEAYKRNMFALLGKPGFEAEQRQLQARIQL